MTADFLALIQKIEKARNTGNTHNQFMKLITEYGEALHDFVEQDPLSKPPLTALKITKADYTKEAKGVTDLLTLSHGLSFGGKVTPVSINREAATCETHGGADLASAKGVGGDEASEYYVDAAMWYFRAAICVYCESELANAKLPSSGGTVATFDAKFKYANYLKIAAQMLLEAATNEDSQDYAERIAENIAANVLSNEAKTVFDELAGEVNVKKSVVLNSQSKQALDDSQKAADKGVTDTQNSLGAWVK